MESPRAGPQSPSEQQNCAQHANSSPSGGKSSAISDELEMVRRARAAQQQEASGGAGAGGADFGHASSPTDAKTTTSSGGSGKKKLAKPKPPPLAANGDAISPRQANAAAANTTPIKTLNLNTGVAASNDEWSSTSPRVAASPRPSFVPALSLNGCAPGMAPSDASGYLAALADGGLSASLTPRGETPRKNSSRGEAPPINGTPNGNALAAAAKGGLKPINNKGATAGGAKQRPQQEQSDGTSGAAAQPKHVPQEEESAMDAPSPMMNHMPLPMEGKGAKERQGSRRPGDGSTGSSSTSASSQPLRATPDKSMALGDGEDGDENEEDADETDFVLATPRASSAKPTGAPPTNGRLPSLSTSTAASSSQPGSINGAPPSLMLTPRGGGRDIPVVESPRNASSSKPTSGGSGAGLVLNARNVMLTPRGTPMQQQSETLTPREPQRDEEQGSSPALPLSLGLPLDVSDSNPEDASLAHRVESPRVSSSSSSVTPGGVSMPALQLPGARDEMDAQRAKQQKMADARARNQSKQLAQQEDGPQQPLQPKGGGGAAPSTPDDSTMTEMTRTSFTEDEAESFEVTVPEGAQAGAVLRLTLPSGELVEIPVPDGAVPGDKLSFELSKSSLHAVEMALSGEQIIFPGKVCKGKRMKKLEGGMHGGPVFEVVVPSGWLSGFHTHFQAQLGEVVAAIPVPDSCEPKAVIHVEAPKGTSKVDVVIPDDATPGSQFVANVGGQLVNVPCPPHMRPGQTLSVAVAGDSALELGEVKVVKPGKSKPMTKGRHLVSPLRIGGSPASGPGSGDGSGSARRKGKSPPMAPTYEMHNFDNAPAPASSGQHSSRGRAASPRPDSPGRAASPRNSARGAPKPKRSSSPMKLGAALLGGGGGKKKSS